MPKYERKSNYKRAKTMYTRPPRNRAFVRRRNVSRKSARSGEGILVLSRSPRNPIPSRAKVCFHMTALMAASNTTGSFATGSYQMNDLYRPLAGFAGTNLTFRTGFSATDGPNCFQNYVGTTALYSVYRVISHGIRVSCSGIANSGTLTTMMCLAPTPDSGTYGSLYSALQARGSARTPGPFNHYNSPTQIKWSGKINEVIGIPANNILVDDRYVGTDTTAPSGGPYMAFWIETSDGSNLGTAGPCMLFIDLFWTVILEHPNNVGTLDT